jgi:uncharacterized protein YutE (UPF0331/DUF86 family)
MTFLVERLAELRKHLDHLYALRSRVDGVQSLEENLSLHNDVLFSLLTVTQLVIDVAGELNARHGLRFENYTEAIRNLSRLESFSPELVAQLARLPGFRNVLIHDYITFDLQRAVDALDELEPVERFLAAVRQQAEL